MAPDKRRLHTVPPLSKEMRERFKEGRTQAEGSVFDTFAMSKSEWEDTQIPDPQNFHQEEKRTGIMLLPEDEITEPEGIEIPEDALEELGLDVEEEEEEITEKIPPISPPAIVMPELPPHNPPFHVTPSQQHQKEKEAPSLHAFSERVRRNILLGAAAIAGIFGVKIVIEKASKMAEDVAEALNSTTVNMVHGRMGQHAPTFPDLSKNHEPPESHIVIPTSHSVDKNDTLWGIAEGMIIQSTIPNDNGVLTLEVVRALREENNIVGNPAKSKKMWVGETLSTKHAADLLIARLPKEKQPQAAPHTEEVEKVKDTKTSIITEKKAEKQTLIGEIPVSLLSPHMQFSGETIWTRTALILESLDVKNPNIAKRSVLSAIVLADSHMSEMQAMRIKYAGHKKFDATKNTLDFTRAAQAALDIKNGMSPSAVAKKYGVTDVYERVRNRQ
jgi:hypothetical protein